MMKYSYKILFLSIMVMGTMMTISANTWLGAWMGLEINLLSFIPLVSDNNMMSTESSLKYFLTQALASSILLFTFIFMSLEKTWKGEKFEMISCALMCIALLIKLGAAPFHFWFPSMMKTMNWNSALILMTWQKLAPFMLMSYIINKVMITCCVLMSAIIGAIGGLAQTSLLKLMAYSSINHMGWMMASLLKAESLWLMYFLFYSSLTLIMVMIFNFLNMFYVNHMMMVNYNDKVKKFLLFLNLFSLGGLPPFLGFIPKWMVIQYLSQMGQSILLTILILTTLITLFFYMRLAFSSFMLSHSSTNWEMSKMFSEGNMLMWSFSGISLMGLNLISLTYNLL